MRLNEEFAVARKRFSLLSFYDKFEYIVIVILTGLIAVFIVFAVWNLALRIFLSIASSTFDPTDFAVFQAVFGMIFTVIIALEFKRSLLVVAERQHSVVQVRTVILIALLAIVRKLLILDVGRAATEELFALAAAILALGAVYWLVRDQDRSEGAEQPTASGPENATRDAEPSGSERGRRNPHSRQARP
jgi:uncharacterized membrane protein (DUF373 family)